MKARVAVPPFGQVTDEFNVKTHDPDECAGEACAVHNPSHHMGDWPVVFRMDYGWPLIERTCPHGVGHPDPDSVKWYEAQGKEFYDGHGCDGCCQTEEV